MTERTVDDPPLDPLALPLRGTHLIEASAGTGKTWTLAALFVRAVLGHGGTPPLLPGQVLVMTFTRAATRELASRIRARLVQAAAAFRGDPASAPDPFLQRLIDDHPPGPARQEAAWRLGLAAEAMDDAAVFTIDGWCQRMLREHAFDSGCLFDEELLADESALQAEAARDHWRQQVYPLTGEPLAAVLAAFDGPDAMLRSVLPLLRAPLPPECGEGTPADAVRRGVARAQAARAQLRAAWGERLPRMVEWIGRETADGGRLKPSLFRKALPIFVSTVQAWVDDAAGEGLQAPSPWKSLTRTMRDRMTPDGLRAAVQPGAVLDDVPPEFHAWAELPTALATAPQPAQALRLHAAWHVQQRLAALKRASGRLGFADLLERLDRALDPALGASAERLRQRIRAQYPLAMVDEFQDTSPRQLRVLERLYGLGPTAPDDPVGLLLIGDPKQAIYGFRGADIHSYLRARRATAGRHHRLGTNHRSSPALVEAVNALFLQAERRPGGAFRLGDEAGSGARAIPFHPVRAQGGRGRWCVGAPDAAGGRPDGPALEWAWDPRSLTEREAIAQLSERCAEHLVQRLNDPDAGFEPPGAPGRWQRLQPGDIAVLVRTGRQALAVRRALARRGVPSTDRTDRSSVWGRPEAGDLLRLLQAAADPRDMARVKAALATPLVGLDATGLMALADDAALDPWLGVFAELQSVWQQQGVLAMVRRALLRLDLPSRLLAQPSGRTPDAPRLQAAADSGERRLTDLLHLGELLQAASTRLEGPAALIADFAARIAATRAAPDGAAGGGEDDDALVRLESDAERVQVVTIHRSKGLEYPVVYLPFAASVRPVNPTQPPPGGLWVSASDPCDPQAERRWCPQPPAQALLEADEERLREDLRLLYVALTRARHAVWLGVAPPRAGRPSRGLWPRCALGALLGAQPGDGAVEARESVVSAAPPGSRIDGLDADPDGGAPIAANTALRAREALPPLAPPLAYQARFERDWSISSYSALVRGSAPVAGWLPASPTALLDDEGAPDAQPEAGADAGVDAPSEVPHDPTRGDPPEDPADAPGGAGAPVPPSSRALEPWHRFPRGAWAGNFLHGELEWLAGEGYALPPPGAIEAIAAPVPGAGGPGCGASAHPLAQALLQRCARQGWGAQAEAVLAWLCAVCHAPIPALGVPLSGIDTVLPEMEFWLPADGLDSAEIDRLCRTHLWPGEPRPALPERRLRGLLMGFADLVYGHGGRYGVLDFKSNALGPTDAHYTEAAMVQAMLHHRYEVQAALYQLALHRLLRQRLGAAYAPERHLHGAIYHFLRGIGGAHGAALHLPPCLPLLEALDRAIPRSGPAADATDQR